MLYSEMSLRTLQLRLEVVDEEIIRALEDRDQLVKDTGVTTAALEQEIDDLYDERDMIRVEMTRQRRMASEWKLEKERAA